MALFVCHFEDRISRQTFCICENSEQAERGTSVIGKYVVSNGDVEMTFDRTVARRIVFERWNAVAKLIGDERIRL